MYAESNAQNFEIGAGPDCTADQWAERSSIMMWFVNSFRGHGQAAQFQHGFTRARSGSFHAADP